MDKIIYELNFEVSKSAELKFLKWLRTIRPQLEKLEGFLPSTEMTAISGYEMKISVRFHIESHEAFNRFEESHPKGVEELIPNDLRDDITFNSRVMIPYRL